MNAPPRGPANAPPTAGSTHAFLRRVVDVRPGEVKAMLLSCLYFFFALSSYFILRPIRDEMAVASGARTLPWLFSGTLAAMIVANPLYAAVVARLPVRRFVAVTYAFFALNLVVFYVLWRGSIAEVATGRAFFIWTSVFNLFVVSVFWGVMADLFHHTQAKRLFGFIAVGGTLGSISGSAITSFLAQEVGVPNLLLVSATFIVIAILLVGSLPPRSAVAASIEKGEAIDVRADRDRELIGGSVWAGFTRVIQSPYLAGIAVFLLLYTFGSTVMYFAQTEIIGAFYKDRELRTAILGRIELTTQVIAGLGQAFLTARIIRVAGLSATLAAVPLVSIVGFTALGMTAWGVLPLLATAVVFGIARRSTEFMLTNPSRKILFTVISREDKYKANSFIETVVYRAGDQLTSWSYAGLTALGLTLTGIAWVAVPLSAIYLGLGFWLGRRQRELASQQSSMTPAAGSPIGSPVAAAARQPAAGSASTN
jgi:AAA family ATP:ADP antiporter